MKLVVSFLPPSRHVFTQNVNIKILYEIFKYHFKQLKAKGQNQEFFVLFTPLIKKQLARHRFAEKQALRER
jgi:hypothetical protein